MEKPQNESIHRESGEALSTRIARLTALVSARSDETSRRLREHLDLLATTLRNQHPGAATTSDGEALRAEASEMVLEIPPKLDLIEAIVSGRALGRGGTGAAISPSLVKEALAELEQGTGSGTSGEPLADASRVNESVRSLARAQEEAEDLTVAGTDWLTIPDSVEYTPPTLSTDLDLETSDEDDWTDIRFPSETAAEADAERPTLEAAMAVEGPTPEGDASPLGFAALADDEGPGPEADVSPLGSAALADDEGPRPEADVSPLGFAALADDEGPRPEADVSPLGFAALADDEEPSFEADGASDEDPTLEAGSASIAALSDHDRPAPEEERTELGFAAVSDDAPLSGDLELMDAGAADAAERFDETHGKLDPALLEDAEVGDQGAASGDLEAEARLLAAVDEASALAVAGPTESPWDGESPGEPGALPRTAQEVVQALEPSDDVEVTVAEGEHASAMVLTPPEPNADADVVELLEGLPKEPSADIDDCIEPALSTLSPSMDVEGLSLRTADVLDERVTDGLDEARREARQVLSSLGGLTDSPLFGGDMEPLERLAQAAPGARSPQPRAVAALPRHLAYEAMAAPLRIDDEDETLACLVPHEYEPERIQRLARSLERRVRIIEANHDEVLRAFEAAYGPVGGADQDALLMAISDEGSGARDGIASRMLRWLRNT